MRVVPVLFAAMMAVPLVGCSSPVTPGDGDTAPSFTESVADQSYTLGEPISTLTLPAASGGNGALSYSLRPSVPGLTFTAATRALSGTPTSAGSYAMTYQAVYADDNTAASDAATRSFTVTVQPPTPAAPTSLSLTASGIPAEGEAAVTVTATLDQPALTGGTTVTLVPGGTATLDIGSGGDYTLTPTTFTIAAGQMAGTATITVTDDSVDDDDETIVIDASSANPALTAAQLALTITDNDASSNGPYARCPADAETWRGLRVCSERTRDGYDRDAFGTGYRRLEDDIIAALPSTMKANGQVYTPYSCIAFDITSSGTAATDIEHIVALAEAHDSGIADDQRRAFASDLDNLTIADPKVNGQKWSHDAAEWMPTHHRAWFADRVIGVKLEYGLTVDPAERDALDALLTGGGAQLNCVN